MCAGCCPAITRRCVKSRWPHPRPQKLRSSKYPTEDRAARLRVRKAPCASGTGTVHRMGAPPGSGVPHCRAHASSKWIRWPKPVACIAAMYAVSHPVRLKTMSSSARKVKSASMAFASASRQFFCRHTPADEFHATMSTVRALRWSRRISSLPSEDPSSATATIQSMRGDAVWRNESRMADR